MRKYIYFNDGRAYYDGDIFRCEKLPAYLLLEKRLDFSIDQVFLKGNYPKKIMDYFYSLFTSREQVDSFTYYLSQIIGGKVYKPVAFCGMSKSGKTVLLNLIQDIFKPFVCLDFFDRILLLNDRIFIIENKTEPLTEKEQNKYQVFHFFNEIKNVKTQNEILEELRPEYPGFILSLMFRYEDFFDQYVEGIRYE
jgi:hypothetical protein